MATNKNASFRYRVLDKCFQNRNGYALSDLIEKVSTDLSQEFGIAKGISKRTIQDDINLMRSPPPRGFDAPIICQDGVYFYEDSKFSIHKTILSDSEAKQLKSALQVLSKFKGIPQFDFINEIIPAIESKLGLVPLEKEVISFENNLDYEGSRFITPLFNSIVNKTALKIEYQDFKSISPYIINFHPYYLKQFNNRWFVFGYNEFTTNSFWNMALDRIKAIQETKTKYIESDTDWEEYFYDFIGVTKKEENIIEIKLLFSPDQAPYILTKPIHPTQKSKNTKEGLEISIKVIPNYELEKLILSFGETVKVISPKSFQKTIFERIKKTNKLY